jgi:glycosyltransferase involved in cell wall biosynthesis
LGYRENKIVVIPNGYDLDHFSPNLEARQRLRAEWGIADNLPLLGMVARYDPQKDHVNLIKALGMLKKSGKEFRCVLVGTGMDLSNSELVALIEDEDIEDRVLLLGRRLDIQKVMNAIDLHILSSYGEAFPNVLAEAMACGTPCITTDVGDAALIVGETGWVVPPKNPEALLQTIAEALDEWQKPGKWDERKIAARERINDNFRIQNILETYVREWQDVYSRHS